MNTKHTRRGQTQTKDMVIKQRIIPELGEARRVSSTHAVTQEKQQALKTLGPRTKTLRGGTRGNVPVWQLSYFITARGFALIELLVVVLIIGILAAVALPHYQKAIEKSRATQGLTLIRALYEAQKNYYLENGDYATQFAQLNIQIPWTGNVKFIKESQATDTKSNTEWTAQITREPGSFHSIFVTRNSGKYRGAGFLVSLLAANPEILCFERQHPAQVYFYFDPSLQRGAYCEQIIHATYSREDTWTRMYDLP